MSTRRLSTLSLVTALLCLGLGLRAQSNAPVILPELNPSAVQGLEGGFWRTDGNFDPILRLKNVLLKQSLQVTPSIYFADGTEYDLPPITLEPSGISQINLRDAIDSAPASLQSDISSYGMTAIKYHWSWPAVIATIQNTDEIASLTFTSSLQADMRQVQLMPELDHPQSIRGTWWQPTKDADGFLVLENSSMTSKQADVLFTGHNGAQLSSQQVTLPSHSSTLLKFSAALGAARGAETIGGIEVHYSGPDHGVLAYAGILDESSGYSASPLLFEDHLDPSRPLHKVTLDAPGLLLGKADPAMLFPVNTYFTPYAILHNISSGSILASLSLVTQDQGGNTFSRPLQQISIQPDEVVHYDLLSQFAATNPLPNGYGNLTITFNGHDGDLMVQAGSVDQSESYVFEVAASQESPSASRTVCFWSVEGDNDSMITVWNYRASPQDLVLTLHYEGGQYVLPLHLGARESYNLDMMSLIRSEVPDAAGTLIPSNITNGSAVLSGIKNQLQSVSVAVAASVFNVRNATCGEICNTCNGVTSAQFNSSSYPLPMNGSVQTTVTVTMNTGETETNPPGQWETGDASIATVNSSGNVTGVYPGVTNVQEVLVSMPVDAGTICSQQYVPCPTESIAESPSQIPVFPEITGISTFIYGQTGRFVITGSGFQAWTNASVLVHFGDYNISNGQVYGTVQPGGTQITGTTIWAAERGLTMRQTFGLRARTAKAHCRRTHNRCRMRCPALRRQRSLSMGAPSRACSRSLWGSRLR